jgi:hypothetical protein
MMDYYRMNILMVRISHQGCNVREADGCYRAFSSFFRRGLEALSGKTGKKAAFVRQVTCFNTPQPDVVIKPSNMEKRRRKWGKKLKS